MRIDAHQHFWLFDPVRDSWITSDMARIRRNFLPNDIAQTLKDNGIDGIVAVQADQSIAETRFLVELSEVYRVIRGVVGWVDLRSPDIDKHLLAMSQYEVVKGFRHIVEAEEEGDFLMREDMQRGIAALTAHGYTFDLLIRPRHFAGTLACVRANPAQKFMLDHLAKPDIRNGAFDEWATFIEQIAQHDNVHAKISGLVTEADWNAWKVEDFGQYIAHAIAAFGKARIVFGSDWPVSLLAAEYEQVLEIVDAHLTGFSAAESAAFYGGNAVDFYGLK